jgi:aminoglycoside phosphotransferase (APT) family kinase protein
LLQEEPERRRAVAYTVEGSWGRRRIVGYFVGDHAHGDLASMKQLAEALEGDELRVAEPIGYLPELRMLLMEFGEGEPLAPRLYEGRSGEPARRMAFAAASLHTCGATTGRPWGASDELRLTARWEEGLDGGDLRVDFRALLDRVKHLVSLLDKAPVTTVHGRLTPERFRDERGRTVLFLSDRVRRADPALDLGHFRAFLGVRGIQFPHTRHGCRQARSVFLTHYEELCGSSAGPRLARRTLFYEASSLLRLAGAYGTRERWMRLLPERLLNEARTLLEEGEAR